MNIFRVGLFENPYLNVENTVKIVGNPEFMKKGYEAQLKSVIMLKNISNVLPAKDSEGHVYDFGYGMNWNGVIDDWRTHKYKNE